MKNINEPPGLAHCVWDPIQERIYTTMKLRSALEPQHCGPDEYICVYSRKTLAEMVASEVLSAESKMCTFDEAMQLANAASRKRYCTGPTKISKLEWWDLLEVLYPARWEHYGNKEIFMMPECVSGDIYVFGVRIGNKYFKIYESRFIAGTELIKQCKEAK